VEIQIWDTGPGIPADQQAMVFEEFVQLQSPARDRAQGLGLGGAGPFDISPLTDDEIRHLPYRPATEIKI
jgi:hypothetical protein